ncbi:MAG TPA: amidohydrolase [Jiangellales bacterium]|nr:amidohydrolase [Jiangellales bacterium]
MSRSTLLRNGRVYSPGVPFATAVLVTGERIAWVGDESAATAQSSAADDVVDLGGALVTPAFVDAHVHVLGTGLGERGVDVAGARSLDDFLDRLRRYARSHPGEPIGGQGWDEHDWPERRPPTREQIDAAAEGAVVLLGRVDSHSSLISTALVEREPAIAAADGYEGVIVRRQAQTLARQAADRSIPDQARREIHREVLLRAARLGIGAVHEMAAPHINSEQDVRALLDLTTDQLLPEVVAYWGEAGADGVERALGMGAAGAAGDLTVDGSLGSRSAGLDEPYADDPSTVGQVYLDVDAATDHVVACTRAGLQAGFHCIGEAAVRIAVTAIANAARRCGDEEVVRARHRLEHVEMISPSLIEQMARLGIVASVQPVFDALWGGDDGMYASRLGTQRAARLNPFGPMARAGVGLAFGSDSPVTPLGGWEAVRAAVYHHNSEYRMSVRRAFQAATTGGWRAAKVPDTGTIAPGMAATFAVWELADGMTAVAADQDRSGAAADSVGLPDLAPGRPLPRCVRTVVRGRTVFER